MSFPAPYLSYLFVSEFFSMFKYLIPSLRWGFIVIAGTPIKFKYWVAQSMCESQEFCPQWNCVDNSLKNIAKTKKHQLPPINHSPARLPRSKRISFFPLTSCRHATHIIFQYLGIQRDYWRLSAMPTQPALRSSQLMVIMCVWTTSNSFGIQFFVHIIIHF